MPPITFDELTVEFKKWMNLDSDPLLLRLVTSVIIANRLEGAPVWALLIGASGSGKSQILSSMENVQDVHVSSTFTPASLLSGWQQDGVNDSLLYQANQKTIIIRDFSTVMSLYREAREQVFSLLRDAYDGSLERNTGKGKLSWKGKFGLIAAATPHLEKERSKEPLLGERFINIRVTLKESREMINAVLSATTRKKEKQEDLSRSMNDYLDNLVIPTERLSLPQDTVNLLIDVSRALVKVRSGVDRNAFTKEIEFPAEVHEMPTRVLGQMTLMALACRVGGGSIGEMNQIIIRLLHDAIPYVRMRILKAILNGKQTQSDIAASVKVSQPYMNRLMEEMRHLEILKFGKRVEIADEVIKEALRSVS